jgi:hypothetical protein
MNEEDEEAFRNLVTKRLANYVRMSDITQELCEQTGMAWPEAESFVREVASLEEKTVHRRRSPALMGLGLVIFVGGVGLMFVSAFFVSNLVIFYRTNLPELLSTVQILIFIVTEAPSALWLGSFGLAMVVGSLVGMREVWANWLY